MEIHTSAGADPADLRMAMVDQLRGSKVVDSPRIEAAMRAVPRHVFLPETPPEQAYGASPVVTHRDAEGVAISSASAPGVVGGMLEQLDLRPGHRVLEIGAGTGYNAALLAHLVGPTGAVTTVEYDATVTCSAQHMLAEAGHSEVTVICGDGADGYAEHAPYDRIVVTAGAWDIAAAWWNQLADDGLLLVPLRIRGLTRTVALQRDGALLRSQSIEQCGFIPMRGAGAVAERNVWVGGTEGDLLLRVDDGQSIDTEAIGGALDYPAPVVWTDVPFVMPEILDFWLAGLEGFCRVLTSREAVDSGRVVPALFFWGSMGVFDGGSLAYLTTDAQMSELGVVAYGPNAPALAHRVAGRVQEWYQAGGPRMAVEIEAHLRDAAPAAEWLVVEKDYSRIVVRMLPTG